MIKEKIAELDSLQKRILKHMVIRCRSTTSGLGLSCFDDVFPEEHPESIRRSIKELIEKGYLTSPEKTVDKPSSIFFTDDGFHECNLAFKKEVDSQREKVDLVNEYIRRLRSNRVIAVVIIIVIAIPWVMGFWKIFMKMLEMITKAW